MRDKLMMLVVVSALAVACTSTATDQGSTSGSGGSGVTSAPPTTAPAASLSWDAAAASTFNGDMPPADPKTVCGADDRRFLGELLQGNPLNFKVPKRLADVKSAQSQMLVSGTIEEPSLGTGDFPFDHTMGSDFNADVKLDAPFVGVGQRFAKPIDTVHVELAAGQLPHVAGTPLPDKGIWQDMTAAARQGIQTGFVPRVGDRALIMGSWIVDCGHTDFQTELHPITFMAVARTEGDATVVHLFYNPYREAQLYNPDPAKALAFEDASRLSDPLTVPFPQGLIDSVLALQGAGPPPMTTIDHLSSWALLDANRASPAPFQVCAPDTSGQPTAGASIIQRAGAKVDISAPSKGCVTVTTDLSAMTPGKPTPKVCVTPWPFLSQVASEEAGSEETKTEAKTEGTAPTLDLKAELGKFVQPQFRSRLDADPTMNCYDTLQGPDLGTARPASVDVKTDPNLLLPFYGTIVVRHAR